MLSRSAVVAVVFAVLSFVKQQLFVVASENDVGREEKDGDMSKWMDDEEPRMVATEPIEVKNNPRPPNRKIRGSKFGRISSKKDVPSRRLQTCEINGTFTSFCQYNLGGEDGTTLDCSAASFEDDLVAVIESDAMFCRALYRVEVTLQNNGDDYTINSVSASPQSFVFPFLPNLLVAGTSNDYSMTFFNACFCQESPPINFIFQGVAMDAALSSTNCSVPLSTPPIAGRPPMCDVQITMQTFGCNQNGAAIDCSSIQTPTTQADCNVIIENTFTIENLGIASIDNVTITSSTFQCCDGTGSCVNGTGTPDSNMVSAMQSTQASFQCMVDICGASSRFDLLTSVGAEAENVCTPTDPGPMCSTTNSTELDFGFDCFPLIDMSVICVLASDNSIPCEAIPVAMAKDECNVEVTVTYQVTNIPDDVAFDMLMSTVCYDGQQDCVPVNVTSSNLLNGQDTVVANHIINICNGKEYEIDGVYFVVNSPMGCMVETSGMIPATAIECDLNINVTSCSFVSDGAVYDCVDGLSQASASDCDGSYELTVQVDNSGTTDLLVQTSDIAVSSGNASSNAPFPSIGSIINCNGPTTYNVSVSGVSVCDQGMDFVNFSLGTSIIPNGDSCDAMESLAIIKPGTTPTTPTLPSCQLEYFLGFFPRFIYFFICLIFNFFVHIEVQVCQVEFICFIPNFVSFAFCKIIQITRFVVVTIFGGLFGN